LSSGKEQPIFALFAASGQEMAAVNGKYWEMLLMSLISTHCPRNPAGHTHVYENMPSTHVPPLAHGYDAHSSRLMLHVKPAQPSAHTHDHWNKHAAYVHGPSTHVEPFMHGDDEHSWIVVHVLAPSEVS